MSEPTLSSRLQPRWIVIGVSAAVVLWIVGSYNGLVSGAELVSASWAQVETQMQRRIDLIPNLVQTVKGATSFERETFTEITEARSRWQAAGTREEQVAAASALDGSLSRLLLTFENYPELQATQAFRDLMVELEGTENRIAVARRDYNEAVRLNNVRVKRFPGRLIAGAFGFEEEAFYEAVPGAQLPPTVDFE